MKLLEDYKVVSIIAEPEIDLEFVFSELPLSKIFADVATLNSHLEPLKTKIEELVKEDIEINSDTLAIPVLYILEDEKNALKVVVSVETEENAIFIDIYVPDTNSLSKKDSSIEDFFYEDYDEDDYNDDIFTKKINPKDLN